MRLGKMPTETAERILAEHAVLAAAALVTKVAIDSVPYVFLIGDNIGITSDDSDNTGIRS
jgi:hypothetical protein